jgi:predicted amidohydrolase
MTSGIDPEANAARLEEAVGKAADGGAEILFTPEMSGLLDRDRARAATHLRTENDDPVLARVCAAAKRHRIRIGLGSLAVRADDDPSRLANRSFVIAPDGRIVARYDKIHLFDVDLPTGESWRESAAYRPGSGGVVVQGEAEALGLSICYDVRFPALYQALSAAGATILCVPSAFTVPTGRAHWHTLLRARAIENGCWVIAAAQTGHHEDGRETFGHSLVVDPWGDVILDMGSKSGIGFAEIGQDRVAEARGRVPVLAHRRAIGAVEVRR